MVTENLNCPRPSPRGNELSQILKMVSQTLIFLIPIKKIEEILGQFLKFHTLEMRQFLQNYPSTRRLDYSVVPRKHTYL